MSRSLNKHEILAAPDSPVSPAEVREWGGHVFIRTLSVADGIAFQSAKEDLPIEKVILLFLTFALCDEAGTPLFSSAEVDELASRNPHVITRLGNLALAHNRMAEGDDAVREGE